MTTKATWTFGIADWICQETTPNEDGERREFKVWFCVATNEGGERLRSKTQWEDFDKAQWVADKTQEIQELGLEDVAECEEWEAWFPVYGSAAHSEEDLIAWERRAEEDSNW